MRFTGRKFLLAAVGLVPFILFLTAPRGRNSRVEANVPSSAHSSPASAALAPGLTLPPPTAADVRAAVSRIYADAVETDKQPHYLFGDFNGDGSQDLAVDARSSAAKLRDLNDDLANWILEDPRQIFVPDPIKAVQAFPPKPLRPRVRQSQSLLVIIHGYGSQGWRAPAAQQSYLLIEGATSMVLKTKEEAVRDHAGAAPMPRLLGDVICERRGLEQGFLFWTGGHYAWHQQ